MQMTEKLRKALALVPQQDRAKVLELGARLARLKKERDALIATPPAKTDSSKTG